MAEPRTLRLTSPHMHGADVETLQRDLNAELSRWKVPTALKVDGEYGQGTRAMLDTVCFGLGIAQADLEHGCTPEIRTKVRHRRLTPRERQRFDARAGWRGRLRKRYQSTDSALMLALEYARKNIGVTEHPPNTNTGAQVDKWESACGVHAAPWCGCFANACLVAAGFPNQPWLRYCPSIEAHARAGLEGWRWSTIPVVGALILYGTPIAEHVGIVEQVTAGRPITIEGNTTNGPGGNQANGGVVARRDRVREGAAGASFPIRGYAVPPYTKVAAA